MLHKERVTYATLKEWALESYYDGCRDHAVTQGWSHEHVMGYVSYTFEDGFERPVEELMWRVILLVLSGGWHPEWGARARTRISKQLAEVDLSELLSEVPEQEAELFRHDLGTLKLI